MALTADNSRPIRRLELNRPQPGWARTRNLRKIRCSSSLARTFGGAGQILDRVLWSAPRIVLRGLPGIEGPFLDGSFPAASPTCDGGFDAPDGGCHHVCSAASRRQKMLLVHYCVLMY